MATSETLGPMNTSHWAHMHAWSAPALLSPTAVAAANKELSITTSMDEDDEPPIATNVSAHLHHKKTHNKIPLHDWSILENVQAKICDCCHQLLLSPDHLEETECTMEECCVAINKI